jgi:signal transduction histidine kinase
MADLEGPTYTSERFVEVFRSSLRLLKGRVEFCAAELWEAQTPGDRLVLRAETRRRETLGASTLESAGAALELFRKAAEGLFLFRDLAEEGGLPFERALSEAGVSSIAALPLGESGTPRALLVLYCESHIRSDQGLEDFLEAVAFQASLALETTRCCEEVRVRSQQMQAGARRWKALARLAVGETHDFNNALGLILGNAHMLRTKLASTEESLRALDVIEQAVCDAAEGVKRLQGLKSNIAVGPRVDRVDLNNVAEDVMRLMRGKFKEALVEGVTIELEKDPGSKLAVSADPALLRKALLEVVMTSVQAAPKGGKITLRTWEDLKAVHLSVSDTGPMLSRAASPGRRRPWPSPGVGWADGSGLTTAESTACSLIRSQRGEVVVHSEKGMGTTVTITFPKASLEPPAPSTQIAFL